MIKNIYLEDNIIKKNRIPVLIQDKEWKTMFEPHMSKDMAKIASDLGNLIAKEIQTNDQMKVYKKRKKILMEKILYLSDEANRNNSQQSLDQLESAKEEILKINEEIDEIQFELETLPKEIEKLNLELLRQTIQMAYQDIKEGGQRTKELMEEILKLRKELTDRWSEKISLESRVSSLYSYLHNTLGHANTDALDKRFL